ncbi:MAG TPA: 2-dehydropantoate 2-reductase [Miltoncostaea sp.]|nr:2-dehydropantoate 2-reductase [Miltoncostaea sp.]
MGPGAIGGFVAARLAEEGWPVTAVAHGDTLRALQAGPLRLTDGEDEREVRLRAVGDPVEAGPADLALVCVKSFSTEAAARALAPALADGAVVLSLQNGVTNPAVIRRECADAQVAGVAVYLGCQRPAPGHVIRRPSRNPATGEMRDALAGGGDGAPGDMLERVGAAIGVPVRRGDPDLAQWTKLVANVSLNTVTALGRARVGALFAEPRAVELMLALGRETVAVGRAAGVPLAEDAAEAYVADARRRLPASGGSSTLFDLEDGRRLEREALVGAVVAEGERLGVAVPVSRACDALLRLLSPPG